MITKITQTFKKNKINSKQSLILNDKESKVKPILTQSIIRKPDKWETTLLLAMNNDNILQEEMDPIAAM